MDMGSPQRVSIARYWDIQGYMRIYRVQRTGVIFYAAFLLPALCLVWRQS